MKIASILLLPILLMSPNLQASPQANTYSVGSGLLFLNFNNTTNATDASTSLIGPIFYPLHFRSYYSFYWDHMISPRFTYTLPRITADAAANSTVMLLSFPLVSSSASGEWYWSYGPSFLLYQIKGNGGSTVLNNGGGTSTFARPGKTVTTKNLALELEAGYEITPQWNTAWNLIFVGLMGERLSYNLMWTFNYKIGAGI